MEDKRIEYKREISKKTKDLKAEIVSFLNSDGGTIFLGVDDNGKLLEGKFKYYKEWEETLSNWMSNAFEPNVNHLINIYPNGRPFRIKVKSGTDKPYFFKDGEGFNSKGIYLRVGSTKRLASFEEVQRLIYKSRAHKFERLVSLNQDLTFTYATNIFKEKGLNFDIYGLQLYTPNKEFNNAALYLNDQNPTITKFAVFQGLTVTTFLDKKEFSGSIIKQLDDVLYFANLSNRKKVVITGKPQRDEYLDYPKRALREAIVNCYCHRNWTLSGDIKIEFYDDRVLIFSPGSLPDGLTLNNIKEGMSSKRNPIIVNALDKADYIENYSTGVRRIFEDYIGFHKQPYFSISDNGVIVTLYNRNYSDIQEIDVVYEGQSGENDTLTMKIDTQTTQNDTQSERVKFTPVERRKQILDIIIKEPTITSSLLAERLSVSIVTIKRDIAKLTGEGLIKYEGSSKSGKWVVLE
ncbi:MAG: RNA-binding domain-containing protein [Acholeplasmataceae bacterium]